MGGRALNGEAGAPGSCKTALRRVPGCWPVSSCSPGRPTSPPSISLRWRLLPTPPEVPCAPSQVGTLAKDCLEAHERQGRSGVEESCSPSTMLPSGALLPNTRSQPSALPLYYSSAWLLLVPAFTSPGVLPTGPGPGGGSGEESLLELRNWAGNPQLCGGG